jgi:UDP-glucose 4-epimerase
MAKIFVGGGSGFIGSHLIDHLVEQGHEVHNADDLSGGFLRNENKKAYNHCLDLRNREKTTKLIDKIRPEIIYALQANAAEGKSHFCPIDICTRNFDTFLNVITPAINNGLKRFIFTSSMAVYGSGQVPFKEDAIPLPEDPYGVSKLAAEQCLKTLASVHEFEYVIVRPHNVYGPRQNMSDPYRNVITIFLNAILKGEAYYIYGDGEQRRCFSHIDSCITALSRCAVADVDGMTFNVGADTDYSLNELSDAIQEVTGYNLKPIHLKDRAQEVKLAIPDHTLAKKHLGLQNTVTLKEGLKETWEYAKSLGYQKPIYTDFEIMNLDKIPSNWRGKHE